MAISLTNKRNTKIIENKIYDAPHTFHIGSRELIHHGSRTCVIDHDKRTITIDTCGWDRVTTRGKINAFIRAYTYQSIALCRIKGETMLHTGWNGNKHIASEFNGSTTVSY